MQGRAIYENFSNGDVSGLAHSGTTTQRIVDQYAIRTPSLSRLSTSMERAWQGAAAGGAERGASPLIIRHALAAPEISKAVTSIRLQVEAFQTAKRSVVPVPPMPDKPGFLDNMFTFGGANSSYEKKLATVHNANDHNVAVMTQYENATRQNAALLSEISPALQQFPPLPNDDRDEAVQPGAPISRPRRVAPPRGRSSAGTAPGSTAAASQPSGSTATGPGQTGAQSFPTTPSGLVSPEAGLPRPVPVPAPDGARPGQLPGPFGMGYRAVADRLGVPRDAGVFGGPRGTGGAEPGARGGGTNGVGSRGAATPEGAASRGTAGRAGAPGASGFGGGPRKGEAEEDYEHERPSFLVEDDPDELFGNTGSAAPPVIGG